MRLQELLRSNKKELDRIVLDFLPLSHTSNEIGSLYTMMRDYPSRGGKGLRGTMCLLWCELYGGKREDALITAAALETFQNWILIHDDIEDDSDLRRGLPTIHKKYGVSLSLNAGDALHGKMWEMLLQNSKRLNPETALDVLSEFSKMLNETTEGQQMELSWTVGKKWDIRESDYLLMVTKKSAWYTCITPCRLGVIIAEAGRRSGVRSLDDMKVAPPNLLSLIIGFGEDLGIAFQIIDDILNLTADQGKYGKEILGDIFEGKRTIMLIHLLAGCEPAERWEIIRSLSKSREEMTVVEAEGILQKMRDYGSIDYARSVARTYSESALSKFDSVIAASGLRNSPVFEDVKNLIDYLTMRDY